jgi:hypothetical protein
MAALEEIGALIGRLGNGLRLADLRQIEVLLTQVPPEQLIEGVAWTYEALSLIVLAPEYGGDIKPEHLRENNAEKVFAIQ